MMDAGFDAGPVNDGGAAAGVDAGPADAGALDAGPPVEDAGQGNDAGPAAGPDSGTPVMDAGPGNDAGPDGGPDAGAVAMDAGNDAGPSMMDAGSDAGSSNDGGSDAGVDAGPADAGEFDAGFCPGVPCACNGIDLCESDGGNLECVVDTTWTATEVPSDVPPPSQYTVTSPDTAADSLVTDNVTGLVWQQTISTSMYTRAEASAYCAGLDYGGFSSGWRLPTVVELLSIVNLDANPPSPAIDAALFPNTPAGWFWTSTMDVIHPGSAWCVIFTTGYAIDSPVGDTSDVRCVR